MYVFHNTKGYEIKEVQVKKKKEYWPKVLGIIDSYSAYVATSTESDGAKIDGFLYPNFM